jgi:hypothetical protein
MIISHYGHCATTYPSYNTLNTPAACTPTLRPALQHLRIFLSYKYLGRLVSKQNIKRNLLSTKSQSFAENRILEFSCTPSLLSPNRKWLLLRPLLSSLGRSPLCLCLCLLRQLEHCLPTCTIAGLLICALLSPSYLR